MITVYRITKTRHLATALSGEGSRLAGARWNSPGIRLVYAASTISLATLEIMVHLEDFSLLLNSYAILPISFPAKLVERLRPSALPLGWNSQTAGPASRLIGDAWAREQRSAVLAVPSVISPGELNYILNPLHPDFGQVKTGKPAPFRPDPRLMH
jgi:RES domain-containing protein